MPGKIKIQGLKGLDFNSPEDKAWIARNKAAGIITDNWNNYDIQQLYRNKQFIDKFGIDRFNSMVNDPEGRNTLYRDALVNEQFFKSYNPYIDDDESRVDEGGLPLYDPNKGMGRDFFKYNLMSTDAKLRLLESEWKTPKEMESFLTARNKARRESYSNLQAASYGALTDSQMDIAAAASFSEKLATDIQDPYDEDKNNKILERIWADDLKKKTKELSPVVQQYLDENISSMSDDEVNSAFVSAIKPAKGEGAAYIYSAYFNDDGTSSEPETRSFSTDDKKMFLAKKAVYDHYLGLEAGYEALNNQGKEFINDNQALYTYVGLLIKDIGISALSYTADQWNTNRRSFLLGQDAEVWMTEDGEIVPTADVKAGKYDTSKLHKQTLSLIALDDMGYAPDGTERGWFNNAKFWSNAEQYGTLSKEEQKKWSELGYSPHKVVYKPGDDSDILYETFKMSSFVLADVASMGIPVAGEVAGLKLIGKAASMVGKASTAARLSGQGLYYTSKALRTAQGTRSALGIGHAYGRGVFGETYMGNLQSIDSSLMDQAQTEIYNNYTTNSEYKAQVDAAIEQRYQELKAAQQAQVQASEGQMIIVNQQAADDVLRSQAQQEVFSGETEKWVDNFKATNPKYGAMLQEAVESASDAALTASLTTGLKYTFINNWGYRSYIFNTPAKRAQKAQRAATRGVTETANSAKKMRISFKSDFENGFSGKQFARVAGSQFWGGAWTNATDELQSEGARRMNQDRMTQFLNGVYDGKAFDTEYTAMQGISSYFSGALSGLAKGNTYRAGLVGGLGSWISFAPNFTSMLTTENFRETWRNASFGEKMNMIITNGVLNEYQSRKAAQQQLAATVEMVDKMLDETDDFSAIQDAIALDLATIDATNPEDSNALIFLKAIAAISGLRSFREDKESVKVGQSSSVLRKAMSTMDKLMNQGKLSQSEIDDFLSQYYAANPSIARSEKQDRIALQELSQRASKFNDAVDLYDEIVTKLRKIEDDRGTKLPKNVVGKLISRLALDRFLDNRISELEQSMSGNDRVSENSAIESYGSKKARKRRIKGLDVTISQVEKEIEEAVKAHEKAKEEMNNYEEAVHPDPGFKKRTELQTALDNTKVQLEYLRSIRDRLQSQRDKIHDSLGNESDRVLSSSEILLLSPRDRARMLDPENYRDFSKEQREQIDLARQELNLRDPSLLQSVQDLANLITKKESNAAAYSRMIENPEAASVQLEGLSNASLIEAAAIHNARQADAIKGALDRLVKDSRWKTISHEVLSSVIYQNLRVLNPNLLEYLIDSEEFTDYSKELKDALEWSNTVTDISKAMVSDTITSDKIQKQAVAKVLDSILKKAATKQDILDEIGKIIEDSGIDASAKSPYEKLLRHLEELWGQKSSTSVRSEEEIEAAKKKAEEEQARKEREREEAERKAAEAAAAGISDEDMNTSNEEEAELAAHGLTEEDLITDNESTVTEEQLDEIRTNDEGLIEIFSPTPEEQANQNLEAVRIITLPDVDTTDQGNVMPETTENLLGNIMFRYDYDQLKYHGVQQKKVGNRPNDKMNRFYKWMEDAGIQLQEIIDQELSDIMKENPDVYPLYVTMERNATNDDALSDFALLCVEYTDKIANIHDDSLGGVITSNGKRYLIIGTMGFSSNNRAQGDSFRKILYDGKVRRKQYFDSNPSERFFVDTSRHSAIQAVTAGRLVRQLISDSGVEIRSISDLLNSKERNPKGLTITELKWGIQYNKEFHSINVSEWNTVYPPVDGANKAGAVFVLVEASNGAYIPAYIRPTTLTEIREGKLKTTIDTLINDLTSSEVSIRIEAIGKLCKVLSLRQEAEQILVSKTKPIVTLKRGETTIRVFDISSTNFDRQDFIKSIYDLDPRINITDTMLSDPSGVSQEMLDEAGALTTDLAKLGTSGAVYSIYAMDESGNPIIPEPTENQSPTINSSSDLSKSGKAITVYVKSGKENKPFHEVDGVWLTETDQKVTDPRQIEQCNYAKMVLGLKPNEVTKIDEIFVVNSDKKSPTVIIRRRRGNYILMTKGEALKTIDRLNSSKIEAEKREALKQEVEQSPEILLSEEEKKVAFDEGTEIEGLTEDQITEQVLGNFDFEPTPQQKTANEIVERITSDTSDIQLSEDGTVYVDSSGKKYARVTSVISADIEAGERFGENNPWGLPSTFIGTSIDNFVRDYFDDKLGNPENLGDRYQGATTGQLQAFVKQLDELRTEFKRRGLTVVPRDVTVTGTINITSTDGIERTLDVAGTLDLLAYDKDGNFYIFDMKTNRSIPNKEKLSKWARQLSLYQKLLEEKYGVPVRGMEIIPIKVNYKAPKGYKNATTEYSISDGKLYANGKEFRGAEPSLYSNIPVSEVGLSIQFSKLTDLERSMTSVVERGSAKPKTPYSPTVVPEHPNRTEDINSTGTRSLAELQRDKTLNTAISILNSKKYGRRVRDLLKQKFPDFPSKMSEAESFLKSKGINTTNISDVEDWIQMIIDCK